MKKTVTHSHLYTLHVQKNTDYWWSTLHGSIKLDPIYYNIKEYISHKGFVQITVIYWHKIWLCSFKISSATKTHLSQLTHTTAQSQLQWTYDRTSITYKEGFIIPIKWRNPPFLNVACMGKPRMLGVFSGTFIITSVPLLDSDCIPQLFCSFDSQPTYSWKPIKVTLIHSLGIKFLINNYS